MTSKLPTSPRASGWPGPRRGWLVVATLAVTETTSYGVLTYAFGVFLLPMQHDLGWSRTAITSAYSLAIILSGVAAIPVGRWLDRHGARALMTAGSVAATMLVLAWARVTDLRAFYAIWAGIGVVMAAVLYEPAFAVIASWFRDGAERTRALLALTVVAGFASVIYVPLAGWLVQTQGWRDALVALAVLLVPLTVLPSATLPGRRPDHLERQPGQQPATPPATNGPDGVPLARALRDQALWWLGAGSLPPPWPPPPSPSTWSPTFASSSTPPGSRRLGPGSSAPCRSAAASWSPPLAAAGRSRSPPRRSSPSKPSRSWSSPCRADQLE